MLSHTDSLLSPLLSWAMIAGRSGEKVFDLFRLSKLPSVRSPMRHSTAQRPTLGLFYKWDNTKLLCCSWSWTETHWAAHPKSKGVMSAAQGLLNSVFSCSSPASKAITKRRLRQTRSLDPALIRHYGTGTDGFVGVPFSPDAGASPERLAAVKPSLRTKVPTLKEPITPSHSSPSIPLDVSPSSNFHFDYDTVKRAKRNTAGDLPFLVRGSNASGSTGNLFSPRRWLQKKAQPYTSQAYVVWKSEVNWVIKCLESTLEKIQDTKNLAKH